MSSTRLSLNRCILAGRAVTDPVTKHVTSRHGDTTLTTFSIRTPNDTYVGSVIMDIIATKNEPDFQRTGGLGDPTIVRKEARTSVLIKDGDTTVIGGIYTRNQSTNYRGVPFLSSIPILGWLFKKNLRQDNRTELLIFITPRIVNRPDSIGS